MKNKICIVTSGRADYSLLKKTIFELKKSKKFKVFILATGMHLSKKFGYTINEIVEDGLKIKKKINILLDGTSPLSVAKSFAIGTNKFTKSFFVVALGGFGCRFFSHIIHICQQKKNRFFFGWSVHRGEL